MQDKSLNPDLNRENLQEILGDLNVVLNVDGLKIREDTKGV